MGVIMATSVACFQMLSLISLNPRTPPCYRTGRDGRRAVRHMTLPLSAAGLNAPPGLYQHTFAAPLGPAGYAVP